MSQAFRRKALASLTNAIGVYALVDLDGQPIYVGQSVDGIRNRVRRHLTSARSDIIANRQVDVWEIAEVWAWPVIEKGDIPSLERALFHHYDQRSKLMNGTIPAPAPEVEIADPSQKIAVMSDDERRLRLDPTIRLPRQIEHYQRLVDHILTIKDSRQLRRSVRAHYDRLSKYHSQFLGQVGPEPVGSEER